MVASISAAYGSGHGYPPASQAVTVAVRTEQDTLAAQVNQGGSQQTLSASNYRESVTISIGPAANASSLTQGAAQSGQQAQTQSGQQALATVEQTAAEARDFLKNDAKKKLQDALAELKLLKLLGNSAAGAKEAARIAREIADAASQYAEGGGAGDDGAGAATDAATAGTNSTGTDAAAAGSPAASSQTAAPPNAAATASAAPGTASALTPAQQDPFYQSVDAALAELKKYLQKTLPALETSSDKKTRKTAKEVAESFDQSLVQVADAEAAFNAESGGATESTAALGGGDSAATAAAVVVAASYQSVNLTA
jgi:hypothetical protein